MKRQRWAAVLAAGSECLAPKDDEGAATTRRTGDRRQQHCRRRCPGTAIADRQDEHNRTGLRQVPYESESGACGERGKQHAMNQTNEDYPSTDLAVVRRAQHGDRNAFDLLVVKYQHTLKRVISRYVSDRAEVSDVTQEAFLRPYRALPGFRCESNFYTWLYRIALNAAKSHSSSRRRHAMVSTVSSVEGLPEIDASIAMVSHDTLIHQLIRDETRKTLVEAIEELPATQRKAMAMRAVDGLSYREIAHATDVPVGTVRSRLFRAREALYSRLQPGIAS